MFHNKDQKQWCLLEKHDFNSKEVQQYCCLFTNRLQCFPLISIIFTNTHTGERNFKTHGHVWKLELQVWGCLQGCTPHMQGFLQFLYIFIAPTSYTKKQALKVMIIMLAFIPLRGSLGLVQELLLSKPLMFELPFLSVTSLMITCMVCFIWSSQSCVLENKLFSCTAGVFHCVQNYRAPQAHGESSPLCSKGSEQHLQITFLLFSKTQRDRWKK